MARPPIKFDSRYGGGPPRDEKSAGYDSPGPIALDESFPPAPIIRPDRHARKWPGPPAVPSSSTNSILKSVPAKIVFKVVEWVAVTACIAGLAWVTTRASKDDVKEVAAACASASSAHREREAELAALLAEERGQRTDAGAWLGEVLNKQDAINKHVWEINRKKRDETPPPALGPKALQEGRQ